MNDREQLRDQVRILEGIHRALTRWPEVSALAFESDSVGSLVEGLGALLGIDEEQASAVSEMQVRRVSRAERERIAQSLAELRAQLDS